MNTTESYTANVGNTNLSSKDIALDMLKDSKFGLTGLTMAIAESSNPQLRQMLSTQLNSCISMHHRLSDMAIQKNWYQAYAAPAQQIQTDIQEAQNVVR